MTIETSRQKIVGIQCLRGIAALMIVVFHLEVQVLRLGMSWPHLPVLQAGVDIFFVISGFIIWRTTATRPDRTIWQFYKERARRIVPLYWLVTGIIVAALVILPSALRTTVFDLEHIVKSYLFIPARHPISNDFQPTLIPGWSLNLEVLFYLIFGIAIAAAGPKLARRSAIIVSTLTAIVLIGLIARPGGVLGFYTQDLLLEFAAGVLLGVAYGEGWLRRGNRWWIAIAGGTVALVLVQIVPLGLPRAVEWGIPATAIVTGGVLVPFSLQPLERLGDWSYSLYLTHPITLAGSSAAWRIADLGPGMVYPVAAVVLTVIVAGLTYRLVERPIDRLLMQWMSAPKSDWRVDGPAAAILPATDQRRG
jgi:exopolysaccharide production protein ExoZ